MAVDAKSLITLADLKLNLGITATTDDAVLEKCIDRASKTVESYCGRVFTEQVYRETYDTSGQRRLALNQYPVSVIRFVGVDWNHAIAINSTDPTDVMVTVSVDTDHVHLHRVTSTGSETNQSVTFTSHETTAEMATHISTLTGFSATSLLNLPSNYLRKAAGRSLKYSTCYLSAWSGGLFDYQADMNTGIVYGPQIAGYKALFVDYTAGYATIPYDVQEATMSIASRMYYGRKRDGGLASESLGGYSYSTRSSAEIDAEAKTTLQQYRRIL